MSATTRKVVRKIGTMRGVPVKLLQWVSLESDLIPRPIIRELERAAFDMPHMTSAEVDAQLQRGMTPAWWTLNATIERDAVAAASLAQVHRARLPDNRDVAVKLKYPRVEERVARDFMLVRAFLRTLRGGRRLAYVLQQLEQDVLRECDFSLEAQNLHDFRSTVGELAVTVPMVLDEFSNRDVLVMSWVAGQPWGDWNPESISETNRRDLAQLLGQLLLIPCLQQGLVYADFNMGNLLVDDDGRLGLVDFGSVARLDQTDLSIVRLLLGLPPDSEPMDGPFAVVKWTLEDGVVAGRKAGMFVGLSDQEALALEETHVRPFRRWTHEIMNEGTNGRTAVVDDGRARFLALMRSQAIHGVSPNIFAFGRSLFAMLRLRQRLGFGPPLRLALPTQLDLTAQEGGVGGDN